MGLNVATTPAPYILAQSAVPVILAPNGTVDPAGAIVLGTALPTTYSGGAWVRLPAGAVVGGLAGLYWTVFSNTTTGAVKTLFVDPATAFTPYVPSVALVAAVGSNAAYTQTTAATVTLANVTLPGGAMGANGGLRTALNESHTNSAGVKTLTSKLGTRGMHGLAPTTSLSAEALPIILRNRGVYDSQIVQGNGGAFGPVGNAQAYSAINTAIDQPLTFTGQLAVATDYIVLEGFTVEVLPS